MPVHRRPPLQVRVAQTRSLLFSSVWVPAKRSGTTSVGSVAGSTAMRSLWQLAGWRVPTTNYTVVDRKNQVCVTLEGQETELCRGRRIGGLFVKGRIHGSSCEL